jgi:hypothetical protein
VLQLSPDSNHCAEEVRNIDFSTPPIEPAERDTTCGPDLSTVTPERFSLRAQEFFFDLLLTLVNRTPPTTKNVGDGHSPKCRKLIACMRAKTPLRPSPRPVALFVQCRCDITEGMSALPELAYRVQRGLLGRAGAQVASVRRETIALLNIADTFSVAALLA